MATLQFVRRPRPSERQVRRGKGARDRAPRARRTLPQIDGFLGDVAAHTPVELQLHTICGAPLREHPNRGQSIWHSLSYGKAKNQSKAPMVRETRNSLGISTSWSVFVNREVTVHNTHQRHSVVAPCPAW
jgi:hypothetical protein